MKYDSIKHMGNFILDDWQLTPVEQALLDDTFDQLVAETPDLDDEEIPEDFLQLQDFDEAKEDIITELTYNTDEDLDRLWCDL